MSHALHFKGQPWICPKRDSQIICEQCPFRLCLSQTPVILYLFVASYVSTTSVASHPLQAWDWESPGGSEGGCGGWTMLYLVVACVNVPPWKSKWCGRFFFFFCLSHHDPVWDMLNTLDHQWFSWYERTRKSCCASNRINWEKLPLLQRHIWLYLMWFKGIVLCQEKLNHGISHGQYCEVLSAQFYKERSRSGSALKLSQPIYSGHVIMWKNVVVFVVFLPDVLKLSSLNVFRYKIKYSDFEIYF